jgi:hypothetical protein
MNNWLRKYQMRGHIRKMFKALDAAGISADRVAISKDGTMRVIDGAEAAHEDLMEMVEGVPGMKESLDAAMLAENQTTTTQPTGETA